MTAPQVIMIVSMVIGNVVSLMKHGKIEMKKENAVTTIIATIIQAAILYCGGFWD